MSQSPDRISPTNQRIRELSPSFLRESSNGPKSQQPIDSHCYRCAQFMYQLERFGPIMNHYYHQTCFRCATCDIQLNLKNYFTNSNDLRDKQVYCRQHAPKAVRCTAPYEARLRRQSQDLLKDNKRKDSIDRENSYEFNDERRPSDSAPRKNSSQSPPLNVSPGRDSKKYQDVGWHPTVITNTIDADIGWTKILNTDPVTKLDGKTESSDALNPITPATIIITPVSPVDEKHPGLTQSNQTNPNVAISKEIQKPTVAEEVLYNRFIGPLIERLKLNEDEENEDPHNSDSSSQTQISEAIITIHTNKIDKDNEPKITISSKSKDENENLKNQKVSTPNSPTAALKSTKNEQPKNHNSNENTISKLVGATVISSIDGNPIHDLRRPSSDERKLSPTRPPTNNSENLPNKNERKQSATNETPKDVIIKPRGSISGNNSRRDSVLVELAKCLLPTHRRSIVEENQNANINIEGDDKNYGQIRLSVFYSADTNRLSVTIHEAKNLLNTDKKSLSDPYARVYLLPDEKKSTKRNTKVVKDNLNPIWEETFDYTISLNEANLKTLHVNLKDEKGFFEKQESQFLGEVFIKLSTKPLKKGFSGWFYLQPKQNI